MKNFECLSLFSVTTDSEETNAVNDDIAILSDEEKHLLELCHKIRILAQQGKIRLDDIEYYTNGNRHLFKFMRMCSVTPLQFVSNYLLHLQPYSLHIDRNQSHPEKKIYCLIDISYKVSLYLKIDLTQFNELVLSFHENQFKASRTKQSEFSLLFSDNTGDLGTLSAKAVCKIPHGFSVQKVQTRGVWVDEHVLRVPTAMINAAVLEYANMFLKNCFAQESTSEFNSLKGVSFTSYGSNLLNQISILVDYCFSHVHAVVDYSIAYDVLELKCEELLSLDNSKEQRDALLERYSTKTGIQSDQARELLGGLLNG